MPPYFFAQNCNFLSYLFAAGIALNFVLLTFFVWFNFTSMKAWLAISHKTALLLLFIFGLSLGLRIYLSPHLHDDVYNEWEFMEAAQTMLLQGKYALCLFGSPAQSFCNPALPVHPPGVPFLLTLVFAVTGVSDQAVFYTNIFMGSLSVVLVFLLGKLLAGRDDAALYSALFFGFVPLHIRFSGTGLLEPISLFFQLLAVLSLVLALRINTAKMWLLAFLVISYAVQTRPEAILLLVLMPAGFFLLRPSGSAKLNISWYHYVVLLLLLLPNIIHLIFTISAGSFKEGKDIPYFSLEHARTNFLPYISFWLKPDQQLFVFPFLALLGGGYLWPRQRHILYFLGIWFFMFLAFFIPYHMNPVGTYTAYRYMVAGFGPLSLLMGYGVLSLSRFLRPAYLFILIGAITFASFLPHVYTIRFKDPLRLAETEVMFAVQDKIAPEAFVIGQPALISIHRRIINPEVVLGDPAALKLLVNLTDQIYLYQDISCMFHNWAPKILNRYPHRLITSREVPLDDQGAKAVFAVYQLQLPKDVLHRAQAQPGTGG